MYKLNSWAFLQCPIARKHCLNPTNQNEICSKANLNIIKTVRCKLQDVKELMKIQGLKVIVLHRDPRGVMNSRIQKHWCTSKKLCILKVVYTIFSKNCVNCYFLYCISAQKIFSLQKIG